MARRNSQATGPHPVDVTVGERIRERRVFKGMSQTDLARALNFTFQQVQKYERGANHVSASVLAEIATALGVPISYFFDEAPAVESDLDREVMEMMRLYRAIQPRPMRDQIRRMAAVMASTDTQSAA